MSGLHRCDHCNAFTLAAPGLVLRQWWYMPAFCVDCSLNEYLELRFAVPIHRRILASLYALRTGRWQWNLTGWFEIPGPDDEDDDDDDDDDDDEGHDDPSPLVIAM